MIDWLYWTTVALIVLVIGAGSIVLFVLWAVWDALRRRR